jgi:hypothetical protein
MHKKNFQCRYCGSEELRKYLSLGDQPPSNSFISKKGIDSEVFYPLEVYFCEKCFLSQLLDVVPAEDIFDDYLYHSSTSKQLLELYADLVLKASKRFNIQSGDIVVDIGCNDGVLLKAYPDNLKIIGVEPSNVADMASKEGFIIYKDFFGEETASKIDKDFGKAKIITATNVFVHVDDMNNFIKGFHDLIADDGVIIIEVSYLIDVIDRLLFDTVYHEHLCYLSLTPLSYFLEKNALEAFDVERSEIGASGPSIRVFIQKKNGKYKIEESINDMLEMENDWGIGDFNTYQDYSKRVEDLKNSVVSLINKKIEEGSTVGAYGAPAKGNTLLNYFNLDSESIDCVAENNKEKIGLLTPGTHIPIVSDEEFLTSMPDFALLLTWNYLDYFLKNSEYLKQGGKFIVPLPKLSIKP